MRAFTSSLPGRVKIGPIDYEIILESKPVGEDGVPVFGKVSFAQCQITIDSDLVPLMQWQCLWHEVLHVVNDQLGLPQDEGATDGIAYKLLEILIDNGFLQFPALETPEYE